VRRLEFHARASGRGVIELELELESISCGCRGWLMKLFRILGMTMLVFAASAQADTFALDRTDDANIGACTHRSRRRSVSPLGAQAREARIGEVVGSGGFNRFRRPVETPFNLEYEARP
jgi:hypothetical protein